MKVLSLISNDGSVRYQFNLGAGSGIGRAACNILAREGATIIAVDRNGASATASIQSLGSCRSKNVDYNQTNH